MTPMSCSNGWKGLPSSKSKVISPIPFKSGSLLDSSRIDERERRTGYPRGVMIVVEPTPRSDATVVVVHHPLQSLHVAIRKLAHLLRNIIINSHLALSRSQRHVLSYGTRAHHIIRSLPTIHLLLQRLLVPVIKVFTRLLQHFGIPVLLQHSVHCVPRFLVLHLVLPLVLILVSLT